MIYRELRENRAEKTEISLPVFEKSCDVVVAGLGTAGAFAALSAAQEGSTVIGIERGSGCGGMCTLGSINGYYYGQGNGLYQASDEECRKLSEDVYVPMGKFHPHAKQYAVEKELISAGVEICYQAVILGLYEEDFRIVGVKVLLPQGVVNIAAGMVIDGTSEGHLVRMLDVKYTFGRETDGKPQPFSSVRVVLNSEGKMMRTGHDSGYANQYDAVSLSTAILNAHALHVKDFTEISTFLYVSELIGVREGLLYEGESFLTLEDVLDQKTVEHPLLYCYSDIDKHGQDLAFDSDPYQEWFCLSNLSTVAVQIPVPLGSVVPKAVKGLITTGRCLGVDSYTSSAVRMIRDINRIGECCGVLASMAAEGNSDPMAVDYERLKRKLLSRDCFGYQTQRLMGFNFPGQLDDYTPVTWAETRDELTPYLSSSKPGVAIWSCRRMGADKAKSLILSDLEAEDQTLKYNTALALGITGAVEALPVLREIVENRDCTFLEDCRRSNQLRSAIAAALCGRMGDEGILGQLLEIISPREYDRSIYHQLTEYSYKFGIRVDFNTVYFQHLSHAVSALIRIRAQHPCYDGIIRKALQDLLGSDEYIRRITPNSPDSAEYLTALNIKGFAEKSIPELWD